MSKTIARFELKIGGATIVGEQAGSGHALVFLHAAVGDKRMWRDQLSALSDNYHCIAYDCRGNGETTTPDEPFSHVEDLHQLLDHLEVEKVSLVGCSKGGRRAINFALAYPGRVVALALIAPAISGAPAIAMPDEIEAIYITSDEADEAGDIELVNEIEAHLWLDGPLSQAGRVTDQRLRQLFLDMNLIDLIAPELTYEISPPPAYYRLATLDIPKLVMYGDLDFPQYQQRYIHLGETLPNADYHKIAGTAHLPSMEKPDEVNALLRTFIEDVLHGGADAG